MEADSRISLLFKIQFSSVMSDSLQLYGLWHARLPCSSPTPRTCSNSCPSSWWCHPTISFSVVPFSSCPQSFPASGSFPMSQLFTSGGQSIGTSASVLPMNIQDWFPLGLTGLISLLSKGLSRAFSRTILQKYQFFSAQPSLWSNFRILTWLVEKIMKWSVSHLVVYDSLWPSGLKLTRLLCPWNSPGKNTGVGSHSLLQGIFLTQGSNPGLLHYRQILYHLTHKGSLQLWLYRTLLAKYVSAL